MKKCKLCPALSSRFWIGSLVERLLYRKFRSLSKFFWLGFLVISLLSLISRGSVDESSLDAISCLEEFDDDDEDDDLQSLAIC